ncbi:universal stress protein [Mycetocola manganoxydans]|uniref:Universal stress protein n=1 Tax=Mycetocola manganoxydans TaxID=699879 RepID=A0A3L7A0S0_9MICO|nr:universal stress protein [Mycetocola manganoxydans]RLP73042.1 universal stress protein [Mycetocola manganoxydans]GHD44384.1 universal stress protein [Mycetocola manganoxydans]
MTDASSPATASNGAENRIVVGVDGSESSVRALRTARRLAAALGTSLEAVAVWQRAHSSYDFYHPESDWTPEKEIEKLLQDAAESAFGSDRPDRFTMSMLEGIPAKTLIRHSVGADMLVLGSRGHGGFMGLLVGSVSSACVAHAHCPVLVVHNENQHALDADRNATTR